MTESSPDRLDRIEATLERVSQQLDNQVILNAELRQSTAELRQSTAELRQSTAELSQSTAELRQRTEILTGAVEVFMTSMTTLAGITTTLTNTTLQHQQRIEGLTLETREIREDMRRMQGENSRILDMLERRFDGSN